MVRETVKLALQAILRNALRSFLTILGIVIGVGAVIAMVTIGNGTTAKVAADLARLGSNLLSTRPGQFGPGRASGRRFLEGEIRSGRAACVIGETVRDKLFGGEEPIGRNIRVNKISCEVIGLLASKGQSSTGTDQDDIVIVPLRMFQRRIAGNSDISTIWVSAEEETDTGKVQADMERLLRERRNITTGKEDDFSVRDMKQIAQTQTATTTLLTGLLAAVAGVSLLVGGIGIMNIMLVSVTERTREIGIRLAIGALEGQVLMQFLVEAVVLSGLGGLIGIMLGLGLAGLATRALEVPFVLDLTIVVIAFAFSAIVGIVFGYFPARRAARLDPIEALRHE